MYIGTWKKDSTFGWVVRVSREDGGYIGPLDTLAGKPVAIHKKSGGVEIGLIKTVCLLHPSPVPDSALFALAKVDVPGKVWHRRKKYTPKVPKTPLVEGVMPEMLELEIEEEEPNPEGLGTPIPPEAPTPLGPCDVRCDDCRKVIRYGGTGYFVQFHNADDFSVTVTVCGDCFEQSRRGA